MDEATSVVFQMGEALTDTTNDGTSNVCGMEEDPTGPESLNADTHQNLLVLPFTKVFMSR